jgi:hypothetical protein
MTTKFTSGLTGDVTLDALILVGAAAALGWGVAKRDFVWVVVGGVGTGYMILK